MGVAFGACCGEKSIPSVNPVKGNAGLRWWWCYDCSLCPPISITARRVQLRRNTLLPDVYHSQCLFVHRSVEAILPQSTTSLLHDSTLSTLSLLALVVRLLRLAFNIIRTRILYIQYLQTEVYLGLRVGLHITKQVKSWVHIICIKLDP